MADSTSPSRDLILGRIRQALGRSPGEPPPPLPPPRFSSQRIPADRRVKKFAAALEKLGGKVHDAKSSEDARAYVVGVIASRPCIASNAPILMGGGITALPEVKKPGENYQKLRDLAASAAVGLTSADYALADTGTLVFFSSKQEARLISLLPPVHVAVVPRTRLLSGLDELLETERDPAARSSSMVFVTGPSRTADIEQILVRGVHGPGEVHVVFV